MPRIQSDPIGNKYAALFSRDIARTLKFSRGGRRRGGSRGSPPGIE